MVLGKSTTQIRQHAVRQLDNFRIPELPSHRQIKLTKRIQIRKGRIPTAWASFCTSIIILVIVSQLFAPLLHPQYAFGAYTNTTTDADGITHLNGNNINDTYFYDTTTDSDAGTQQKLGVDPNWKNGVVRKSHALIFDGSDDNIQFPDQDYLEGMDKLTVELWFYVPSGGLSGSDWNILLEKWDGGGHTYAIQALNNGAGSTTLVFVIQNASSGSTSPAFADMANYTGQWVHLAGTYDGYTAKTYVNGAFQNSGTVTGPVNTNSATLKIGGRGNGNASDHINGTVDEVHISNSVRYNGNFTPSRRYKEDSHTLALFHFDEGTGTSVVDSSLYQNSSSSFNGALWVNSGNAIMDGFDSATSSAGNQSGAGNITLGATSSVADDKAYEMRITGSGGLSLDGADDYLTVTDNSSFEMNGRTNLTVEGWVNYSSLAGSGGDPIFNRRATSGGIGYVLENGTAGADTSTMSFYVAINGTIQSASTPSGTIKVNTWHHVAGTYDGTKIRIFVDGILKGETAASGTLTTSGTQVIEIGRSSQFNTGLVTGKLDEIRVSSSTRYNGSAFTPQRRFGNDGSTVALWHFDEGTGQTTADASENGNTATLGATTNSGSDDPSWDEGINNIEDGPVSSSTPWALSNYDYRKRINISTTTAIGAGYGVETSTSRALALNNGQTRTDGKDWRIMYQPSDSGRSLSFDGSTDYVTIPNSTSLTSPTTNLTLEAWVKASTTPQSAFGVIATKRINAGSSPFNSFALSSDATGTKWVFTLTAAGSETGITSTSSITTEWTHVAGVYNGSTMKLYINGVEENSSSKSGSLTYSSLPFTIGWSQANERFNGLIDEVRVSNSTRYTNTFTSSTASYSPDNNTIGLWHFDESSGQYVRDNSSNNNNGYLGADSGSSTDDPSWSTTGKVSTTQEVARSLPHGHALSFDGSSEYVSITDSSAFDFNASTNFTVEAWINAPSSATNSRRIIDKGYNNGSDGWNLMLGNGALMGGIGANGTDANTVQAVTTQTINDGQWHHVAMVVNQVTKQIRLFIDGELENVTARSGTCGTANTDYIDYTSCANVDVITTTDPKIGVNGVAGVEYFDGTIDEVRVSNTARYTGTFTTSQNPFASDGNTVGLWHFDEGSGQTVDDQTGSHDGVLASGTSTEAQDPEWNTNGGYVDTTLQTQFRVVAPIGAASTNEDYFLYYGYASESSAAQAYTSYALTFSQPLSTYATIPDSPDTEFDGKSFTLSLWEKTIDSAPQNMVEKQRAGFTGIFLFTLNRDNAAAGRFSVWDGDSWIDSTSNGVMDGSWHHLVVTYESGTFRLYKDGSLDSTTASTEAYSDDSFPLTIGRFITQNVGWNFFGSMDDIRMYSRRLSDTEIGYLYNNLTPVSDSSLDWHLKLDDTTPGTTTATDTTGGGNNASLTNFNFKVSSAVKNGWSGHQNLPAVTTEPTQSIAVIEQDAEITKPIFYQYRGILGDGTADSWSARTTIPTTEAQLGSTGVYVRFNPNGIYSRNDYYHINSWAIEAFSSSDPHRGHKNAFPDRANFVQDSGGQVSIIDADTNKVWMRFTASSTRLVGFSSLNRLTAKNGRFYVAANGVGLREIAFDLDSGQRFTTSGNSAYAGNIADRNDALGYGTDSGTALTNNNIGQLEAQIFNNKQYVAFGTQSNINVFPGMTLLGENNRSAVSILQYASINGSVYTKLALTSGGELYGINGTIARLDRWDNIQNDTSSQTSSADAQYTSSTTPALGSSSTPLWISASHGTSTIDPGSNTVALAHPSGVDVIQEHSTFASSQIRYYTRTGDTGASNWTSERFGGAASFDGGDIINVTAPAWTFNQPITIEAWVKPSATSTQFRQLVRWTNGQFGLEHGDNNTFRFYYSNSQYLSTNEAVTPNQWYHVAAVYDVSNFYIFVNGVLKNSVAAGGFTLGSSSANFTIGDDSVNPGYQGLIDEVRISNSARYTANFSPTNIFTTDANTFALYHFDEEAGQTAGDASTNRYHGTLGANSSASTDDAKFVSPALGGTNDRAFTVGLNKFASQGTYLDFDGTNDFVRVPDNSALNTTNYTLSAWVRRDGTSSINGAIISRSPETNSAGHYFFHIREDTDVLSLDIPFVAGNIVNGATTLSTGVWYYVTATKNGNDYKLYLNGKLDGTATNSSSPTQTGNLEIGAVANNVTSQVLNGALDDVRIYNRALSNEEVNQIYRYDRDQTLSGLVANWKIDEGSGQTIKNSVSSSLNGTRGVNATVDTDDPTWATGSPAKKLPFMWVGMNGTGADDGSLTSVNLNSSKRVLDYTPSNSGLPDLDVNNLSTGKGGLALVGTEVGAWNPGLAGFIVDDDAASPATINQTIRQKSGTTRIKGGSTRVKPN